MSNASPQAAVLNKASGNVYADRQGTRITLAEGDPILSTDTVVTDSAGLAEVRFLDGSTASLSPGTSLEVREFAFGAGVEPSFILNLAQGTMRSVSGEVVKQNPDAFKIVTPQATVGIRGTELFTAVQAGGQEVHAVLHMGKDHIVVITSNDGRSMVMDQAMQAVNMQGTAASENGMVKQTFSVTEMRDIIQSIAPSQVQKPMPNQQGQPGEPGVEAPTDGAEAAPPAAPVAPTSASAVVVIVYADEVQATVNGAETATDVNTLIKAVEGLQNALADAGFSVHVGMESELRDMGTAGDLMNIVSPPPIVVPAVRPDASPDTGPQVYRIAGDYGGNWHSDYGSQINNARQQQITIDGAVTGVVEANVIAGTAAATTSSDIIGVGDVLQGGKVIGDASIADGGNHTFTLGNDSISFGHLDGAGSVVTGDSLTFSTDAGARITFGNDVITGNSMSGASRVYGDASAALGTGTGTVVLGSDAITINGTLSGNAIIYGDVPDSAKGNYTYSGGNDTITVGGLTDQSAVAAGFGDDVVTVSGNMSGTSSISGSVGNDTLIVHGDVGENAKVYANDGQDVITVGSMSGDAQIGGYAGDDRITVLGNMRDNAVISGEGQANTTGNDTITVHGTMGDAARIDGATGNDSITVNNMSGNAEVWGGSGNDTITVTTMTGGIVKLGSGKDALTITDMQGGSINATNGTTDLRVFDAARSSYADNTLYVTFTDGTTMQLSGSLMDYGGNLGGTATEIMKDLIRNQTISGVANIP